MQCTVTQKYITSITRTQNTQILPTPIFPVPTSRTTCDQSAGYRSIARTYWATPVVNSMTSFSICGCVSGKKKGPRVERQLLLKCELPRPTFFALKQHLKGQEKVRVIHRLTVRRCASKRPRLTFMFTTQQMTLGSLRRLCCVCFFFLF